MHFCLLPLFGTLALWPDRAGILIGIRLTGAQTKHRDFTRREGLSACHSNTGAEKEKSHFKTESESGTCRREPQRSSGAIDT